MEQTRIKYLIKLYTANSSTKKEVEELFSLINKEGGQAQLKKLIMESFHEDAQATGLTGAPDWDAIWARINAGTSKEVKKRVPVISLKKFIVAATVMIMVMVTAAIFVKGYKKDLMVSKVADKKANIIHPGGYRAMLTLANGSTIILDTIKNGYLINQSNINIIKLNTGLLSYKKITSDSGKSIYNTITTPRGGKYQVELADGTNVWLNAASSLTFPTSFTGKERKVALKGEGYFEVAKNLAMPFHVDAGKVEVLVTGTHFNVMAYAEEDNINTTLIEGKVGLTFNGITKSLQPGKQASADKNTNAITLSNADIEKAVAWKNDEFRFKDTPLKELMRQISRWYDVEVEYQGTDAGLAYTASLPRMQNVAELLQLLELTGTVHFKITNKKIIVLP